MSNGAVGPEITVGVALVPDTAAGAQQAVNDINRVKDAETAAALAGQEISFEEARTIELMREYSVNAQQAARALELLGPAATSAAVGSAELDAAIEAAQRETAALGTATDALAARQARASEIAVAYGVDLNVARMAMGRLGEEALSVAVDSDAMEVAMNRVQAGQAALQAEQARTIAQMEALAASEDSAAAAGNTLVGVSDAVTAAMVRMGVAQSDVSAAALKLGVSEEVAARAMVQMKQALLSADVAAARAELEGLVVATDAEAVSADVATVATSAHNDALQKNAIMSRRASDGLVDLALGGRRAIQGVADLQFVLTSLAPEAAQLFLVLGGIAIVGELWERATKKMSENSHKATSDIKSDWNDANAALKDSMAEMGTDNPFVPLLAGAKQFTEELGLQENMANALQAALDRLEDAKFGQKESALNLQEQQDLQGKSGSQADQIRLQYDQKRDALRSQHDVEKAARDLDAQKTKLADLQDQAAAIQAQINAAGVDAQHAREQFSSGTTRASLGQSDAEYARDRIEEIKRKQRDSAAGLADGNGKAIAAPTSEELSELFGEEEALPQLQKDQRDKGPQYANQIKRLQAQRDALQKQAGDEAASAQTSTYELAPGQTQEQAVNANVDAINQKYQNLFAAIDGQIEVFTETQEGQKKVSQALADSQKAYEDGQKKLLENRGQQAVVTKDIETAGVKIDTAKTNADASAQKDQNSSAVAQEKAARESREQALQAQINELEAKLSNSALTVDQRTALEKQKSDVEVKKLQNQSPDVSAPLVKSEIDKQRAQDNATATKQEDKAEDNSTRTYAKAISDHGKLTTDVASKAGDLAKLVALQAQEQGKVNAATSQALDRAIATMRTEIDKLTGSVNSLKHTHQS